MGQLICSPERDRPTEHYLFTIRGLGRKCPRPGHPLTLSAAGSSASLVQLCAGRSGGALALAVSRTAAVSSASP